MRLIFVHIGSFVVWLVKLRYGVRVKDYTHLEGFKAASIFKEEQLSQYYDLSNHSESIQELPDGIAYCPVLLKKGKIVGTLTLFDPSEITSYTSKLFVDTKLDFVPQNTFEMTRVCLDIEYNRQSGVFFLLLLHHCFKYSIKHHRNSWLVCTHYGLIHRVKKIGGNVTILADKVNYVPDETIQSQYWKIFDGKPHVRHWRAYLIHISPSIYFNVFKRFIRGKRK